MEYQLKLLKIFDNEGFSKIVDLLDELINNEELLLNFLILNMNNTNNIKYLCNFLKKDILKYKNIIKQIINSDAVIYECKETFIFNIFNSYDKNNILLLENNCLKLFIKNLKENNIYNIIIFEKYSELNEIILYKIFNNNIYETEIYNNNNENYMNYFSNIFKNIINEEEDLFIDWLYNLCYIYSYRCKTYSKLNLDDNILFTLLNCVIDKYNELLDNKSINKNNILYNLVEENIDLLNIKYDEIKKYEKNVIYETLILSLLKITIQPSLDYIENNNILIADYTYIINSVNNNGNILQNFDIIKNYVINNNKKLVDKYINLNKVLYNKLNKDLLEKIYKFYIDFINIFIEKECNMENNELFSDIIINIIDFYIFYNKNYTYVYSNLNEKKEIFSFFTKIFNSKSSNINIDIKMIDFYTNIYLNEGVYISGNKESIDIIDLLNKSFEFYIKLDSYEDYTKNNIKYKIICLYNSLFNAPYMLHSNVCKLIETKNSLSKFLISFTEDINIFMTNFMIYYKSYLINKDYSKIASSYYIYIEDYIRFYKYLLKKHQDKIDEDVITISIHKLNKNIIKLNELCKEKNNVYKIILYIIDIYLLLDNKYLQVIKNDIISFNSDIFKNIYENMINIYKHKNILLFYELISEISELEETKEIDYGEIPEEFLDPLYNTLIENPVILPSSGNYMDYDVIKKHLLYHNFDPFNRDELTLDKLEEYNNSIEIREKNKLFKKKIEEWKINKNK
jgi:hypothetical protein